MCVAEFGGKGSGEERFVADFRARLRESLKRVDAPAGFAERVEARAAASGRTRAGRVVWWRAVAAVLLLVLGLGGWMTERERKERMEAREAQVQFGVAMRVAARVTERSFAEAGRRMNRTEGERETR